MAGTTESSKKATETRRHESLNQAGKKGAETRRQDNVSQSSRKGGEYSHGGTNKQNE